MASQYPPTGSYTISTTSSTVTLNSVNAGGFAGSGSASITVPYSTTGMSYPYSNVTYTSGTGNLTGAGLHVTSDAEFEGDLKIKGVSLAKTLEDIQKRLSILVPDPKKLEKFEALQKAYDHYKLLEALCHAEEDDGTS